MMGGLRVVTLSRLSFLLATVFSAPYALAQSATFYVNFDKSPDPARSFKTIDEAQKAVRQFLKEQKVAGDVVVLIERGTYYLSQPLRFTADDSPTMAASTVTYKANPQGASPVVLSGGRQITGWQQEGKLLKAKVAAGWQFRELFVDGHRRLRARTPTTGYFRVVKAGPDNRTSFAYKAGDLRRFSKLDRAEVVFLHDWSISRIAVADIDEKSHIIRLQAAIGRASPFFAISNFEPHPRYALENAPELLDSPGEWYLDVAKAELSYWPVEGETIENIRAVAPLLTSLVTITGDESTARKARNLRFEGLHFSHCACHLPQGGYAESQATMHDVRHGEANSPSELVAAAIEVDAAEACAFDHCRFEHLGGTAVWLRRACKNNRLSHCRIRDVAGNGINIGEPNVNMPSAEAIAAGRALNPVSQGNAITHSRIEHCGALYHGAVGVWIGMANATEVSSNEIRNLPYTGISVGWNWTPAPTVCEGHLLAANHIHHVMQLLSDGGGIYTLGRQPGTILRGNVIHDVAVNAGRAESNGIFMDEGSSEMLVESNIIYNVARSPIRFHQARKNTLRNNQLVSKPGTPPFRYNSTDEKVLVFEGNQTIEAEQWSPPPGSVPATSGD